MKKKNLKAVGYYRVSTDDQSIDQQREAVKAMCEYKGWELVAEFADEGVSGSREKRPALDEALDAVKSGTAQVLAVAKVDRLGRSTSHLLSIAKQAKDQGWHLAIRDLDIDTSTHNGLLVLTVLAAIGEWERHQISVRTKEGLDARRAKGIVGGRKQAIPEDVAERIRRRRQQGYTLQMIADDLNNGNVPTSRGGTMWYPSTFKAILKEPRKNKYRKTSPKEK